MYIEWQTLRQIRSDTQDTSLSGTSIKKKTFPQFYQCLGNKNLFFRYVKEKEFCNAIERRINTLLVLPSNLRYIGDT